jgi:hypothetical protein
MVRFQVKGVNLKRPLRRVQPDHIDRFVHESGARQKLFWDPNRTSQRPRLLQPAVRKFQAMCFDLRRQEAVADLHWDCQPIENTSSVRSLGLHLQPALLFWTIQIAQGLITIQAYLAQFTSTWTSNS